MPTPEEIEACKRQWRLTDGLAKYARFEASMTVTSRETWQQWCSKATAEDVTIVKRALGELSVLTGAYCRITN